MQPEIQVTAANRSVAREQLEQCPRLIECHLPVIISSGRCQPVPVKLCCVGQSVFVTTIHTDTGEVENDRSLTKHHVNQRHQLSVRRY